MGSLYMWLEKVFGASWRITLLGYAAGAYQVWSLIDSGMKGGLDLWHALYASMFVFAGRIVKEARVTGGTVPATVEAVKRTTDAASSPVTPDGTTIAKVAVLLLAVGLTTVACALPIYDPVTAETIAAMKTKSVATASCPAALAHEQGKSTAQVDQKTMRHLKELCACYSAATTPHMEETCLANVPIYTEYEAAKKRKVNR